MKKYNSKLKESKKKIEEGRDYDYYYDEMDRAIAQDGYAQFQVIGSNGKTKWMNINKDSGGALILILRDKFGIK